MKTMGATMDRTMILAGLRLPVKPAGGADGAAVQLVQELPTEHGVTPFFGGYADDFLADLGMDALPEAPVERRSLRMGKA